MGDWKGFRCQVVWKSHFLLSGIAILGFNLLRIPVAGILYLSHERFETTYPDPEDSSRRTQLHTTG